MGACNSACAGPAVNSNKNSFARFGVLPGFWPRALLLRESGIAVPATLVSGFGCFPRGRGARETPIRAWMNDLRAIWCSTWLLAVLGLVVGGIRDSCSGYPDFWLWLLFTGPRRQGNAKTRVDERSTRDLAFYLAPVGRAGPCRDANPG